VLAALLVQPEVTLPLEALVALEVLEVPEALDEEVALVELLLPPPAPWPAPPWDPPHEDADSARPAPSALSPQTIIVRARVVVAWRGSCRLIRRSLSDRRRAPARGPTITFATLLRLRLGVAAS
jgi:hypothetical protein